MAKPNRDAGQDAGAQESTQQQDDPQLPRPPQGIVLRNMSTGTPKLDLIGVHKRSRIDPACFGGDPFLALPIDGDPGKIRVRQVAARDASDLLSCDKATGAPSTYRLATDREVEEFRAEAAKRAQKK